MVAQRMEEKNIYNIKIPAIKFSSLSFIEEYITTAKLEFIATVTKKIRYP